MPKRPKLNTYDLETWNRNTVGNPTSPLEESQLATLPYEENKAEVEIIDKCEVEQNYQMKKQRAISITPQPTSSLSCALTQRFPEFFSATNSSISSVDTNERNGSRPEDDSSRTFYELL
ncbi:hypothetical protein ACI65C_008173 [Semiaphis heraclei]